MLFKILGAFSEGRDRLGENPNEFAREAIASVKCSLALTAYFFKGLIFIGDSMVGYSQCTGWCVLGVHHGGQTILVVCDTSLPYTSVAIHPCCDTPP